MSQDVIQAVVIYCSNVDAPLLDEVLAARELNPASFSDLETGNARILLVSGSVEEAHALADSLRSYLRDWREMLSTTPEVTCESIRQEDWSQSWKKNFHTFRASERLVVKPGWEEYTPVAGDIVIPIDPGMCFGTGYHGTTMACLKYLDKLQAEHGQLSFIDAGTGSGILSIAAGLLGYTPIFAFDNDPQAVTTAQENLGLAGVCGVTPVCAPLGEYVPPERADVVAANILAVVLERQADDVLALLRPGGWLILSGILNEQYDALRSTFTAKGCTELENISIREWTSGLFNYL